MNSRLLSLDSAARRRGLRPHRPAWALGAALLLIAAASSADDRDLFSLQQDQPYVFTILDTSGSMNWEAGQPDGTWTDTDMDSPDSRLYQAKSALYEVIRGLDDGVVLGFAHFEQEDLDIERKHWAYRRVDTQSLPWLGGGANELDWPNVGQIVYFGDHSYDNNDGRNDDRYGYCDRSGGGNQWFWGTDVAFGRAPVMGWNGSSETYTYVNEGGTGFELRFQEPGGTAIPYGAETIQVEVRVRRYTGASTSSCNWSNFGERTITLERVYGQDNDGTPFVSAAGTPLQNDFLAVYKWSNLDQNNVCNSTPQWAPNDTPSTGTQSPVSELRYPTRADPLNRDPTNQVFHRGEVVPWDWIEHPENPAAPAPGFEVANREEILRRLAPNTAVPGQYALDSDGNPIPDFRVARYFENTPGGDNRLDVLPQFSSYPPIVSASNTPLAGVMNNLADWYEDWEPVGSDEDDGDPAYECRQKYLILLSDGEETCGGNPGTAAARLEDLGIRTFVVAFGGALSADNVQDIADAGGTGQNDTNGDGVQDCAEFSSDDYDFCPGPIVAADRNELVNALQQIFEAIETSPQAFASAATSPSRTDDGNSIFLTSFLPVPDQSVWKGSVSHYVQPLPTTTDDDGNIVPDPSVTCAGLDPVRGCLAWDAADSMLEQAPSSITLSIPPALSDFGLGADQNDRRVFYSRADLGLSGVPRARKLFGPTLDLIERVDQLFGFRDIAFDPLSTTSINDAYDDVLSVLRRTYERRSAPDPRNNGETLEWILGDVFHSSPSLISNPNRPEYQTFDLRGYQEFFRKHEFRRRAVAVSANDGMVHFLDAGTLEPSYDSGRLDRSETSFGLGTGKEIFAVVPRALMPSLLEADQVSDQHDYRADGVLWVDDVFIDPLHAGTPDEDDREWRSIAFTGHREGGVGYIAIDVTQPDPLVEKEDTFGSTVYVPASDFDYVPDCTSVETGYSAAACGPVPYGSVLWELDSTIDADLRDSWSTPRTGRIRIDAGGGVAEDVYVMVVGGGINSANWAEGNYLYMVDVETGEVLYKRDLRAGVPSDPAIVDRTGSGYIDYIYIGTLGGELYKVDLTTPAPIDGSTGQIASGSWVPFEIFDTGGRAIFFPPSVIRYQGGTSLIAFGTGNREDLWDPAYATEEGRFFVVVDDFFSSATGLNESSLYQIDPADPPLADGIDPLGSNGGYFFDLEPGEKLLSRAFTLAGVTIFSTFSPIDEPQTVDGQLICETTGFTNIYVVFTTSGDPVGGEDRFRSVEGIVTNPFSDLEIGGSGGDDDDDDDDDEPDGCDESVAQAIRETLPPECRFNNITVPLKMVRADTGLECVVAFPVCIREFNWGDNIR